MKSGQLLSAFHKYFNLRKSTNGWWRFTNPFDPKATRKRDDTMAFNPSYRWVKDFRTGYSKPAAEFLMDLLNEDYQTISSEVRKMKVLPFEIFKRPERKDVVLPDGFNSIAFGKGVLGDRARRYLTGRGFNVDLLDMMGFGYCNSGTYFGYIIIPYFVDGVLAYWSARDFLGQNPKYRNPKMEEFGTGSHDLFFNEDALKIFDRVYVVEGVFDALTIGSNAIATSGWSISTRQRDKMLRSHCKELVYICDKGFYNKMLKVVSPFIFHKSVYIVEPDLPGNDVNEWGWDNVKPFLTQLKPVTYANLFT